MKKRELIHLGFGRREWIEQAIDATRRASAVGFEKRAIRRTLKALAERPADFVGDGIFGDLASSMEGSSLPDHLFAPRETPAPYRSWGAADIDRAAIEQMNNACRLPVAVAGALMPDAHLGYGLPIGGVLATREAVIPYAVGVDIACRMKMTVLDLPPGAIDGQRDRLKKTLARETRFGIGAEFRDRRQHRVLDEDWSVSPITAQSKDRAWRQLGTSGSGNHFVEWGELEVFGGDALSTEAPALGSAGSGDAEISRTVAEKTRALEPGRYLALLSHSGSRGVGARVCSHYSKVAQRLRAHLPKPLRHLAWLSLDSEEGQEYWAAMNLMGRYAAANHELIHHHIARSLGAEVRLDVENHHNFAWRETHDGESLIVHRKGATPAGRGDVGIIPGTMASPAYLVRGLGHPRSLDSASHGAGRVMSRKRAKESFTWSETKKLLAERGVEVLSAGIDEAPMAYRDIDAVMAAQVDLVQPWARFFPRIVKMAPAGERPED